MNRKKYMIIGSILLGLILLIVILVLIFGTNSQISIFKNTDGKKIKNEYEELNNTIVEGNKKYPEVKLTTNNILKYSTVDEILDIFNNQGDGVVYFGYSTCLYCRSAIQVLADTAEKTELDVIHYLDIEDVWDVKELNDKNEVVTTKEASDNYYQLLNMLGNELVVDYVLEDADGKKIKTGDKRLYVPLVIFITDGRVVSYNKGTLFSQEDPFVELDKYQREGLSEIYSYGIRDVVNSKKMKGLLG